jgi:aryl-alcohol dehydrogenase-like predicted oxidoreductase
MKCQTNSFSRPAIKASARPFGASKSGRWYMPRILCPRRRAFRGRDHAAPLPLRRAALPLLETWKHRRSHIDLYWLHIWDQMTPVEEVMRAFDDLVRSGKVLYVGISDAPAWVVSKSNILAELRGWTRYVGLQIEYSLLERTAERELVPMAKDQQMTVLAWSPLRNGLLTGKYLPENVNESKAEGSRMHSEMMKGFGSIDESVHATVRETVAVGNDLGVSAAQVALAWLRYRSVPVIPIIV